MAENDISLDAFISTPDTASQQETATESINLEDEFAKLLNDFIKQDVKPSEESSSKASLENQGLDVFLTPTNNETSQQSASIDNGLDSFITPNTASIASQNNNADLASLATTSLMVENDMSIAGTNSLKAEEQELARAISNFQDGIYSLADKKNLKVPETEYTEEMLHPNYKPSAGKKIAQYMLDCWDLINKADPENMKRLPKDANDEGYLAFAETLSDTDMQLTIISYVEILINLEICEVKYEQKKEIIQKNRIKKELYEEYMAS